MCRVRPFPTLGEIFRYNVELNVTIVTSIDEAEGHSKTGGRTLNPVVVALHDTEVGP